MRVLYQFARSPFSRRVRLVLAHKRLDAELRDARAVPENRVESNTLFPGRTVPVLVDDGVAIGDSTAIATYLDRAYPDPPLWPSQAKEASRAIGLAALADQALDNIVEVGTRIFGLRDSTKWDEVKNERMDRVNGALATLATAAATAGRSTLVGSEWTGADIWVFTAVEWLSGLPSRKGENANIDQVLSLGVAIPDALLTWTDAHRDRREVPAIAR